METTIKIKGKVLFDPPDKTNKHRNQAVWKKIAYLDIKGDVCEYYSWFIKKRFNLPLARPLRGAHITFINDSLRDMGNKAKYWDGLKGRWSGVEIEVELYLEPKTNDISWWLTVVEESRKPLHNIRAEIGLGRPHWGLHMTLGDAQISYDDTFELGVEKVARDNIAHSKYIHELAKKGLI
jgi:hypothetical protein